MRAEENRVSANEFVRKSFLGLFCCRAHRLMVSTIVQVLSPRTITFILAERLNRYCLGSMLDDCICSQ